MSGVHQLQFGERARLCGNTNIGKLDIGIQLTSDLLDIHAAVDAAVLCKYADGTISITCYMENTCTSGFVTDKSTECKGSNWKDDDFRFSLDFDKDPYHEIEEIAIVTNIRWGADLKMHYGLINSGHLRVYSHNANSNILEQHVDFSHHSTKTGLLWSVIYSYKGEWKIRSHEESVVSKDLGELIQNAKSYL